MNAKNTENKPKKLEKSQTHIYRLLDRVGTYTLLILDAAADRGRAVSKNAIAKIVKNALGEEFHHSAFTLRLREFERRQLAKRQVAIGAHLYEITEKGREITKLVLQILTAIEPERWTHRFENIQSEIKRIIETGV